MADKLQAGGHYLHRDINYASSTPAADSNGAVVAWTTPGHFLMVALNNDGLEVWQQDFGEDKPSWGDVITDRQPTFFSPILWSIW